MLPNIDVALCRETPGSAMQDPSAAAEPSTPEVVLMGPTHTAAHSGPQFNVERAVTPTSTAGAETELSERKTRSFARV